MTLCRQSKEHRGASEAGGWLKMSKYNPQDGGGVITSEIPWPEFC